MSKPLSRSMFHRRAPVDRWAEPEPTLVSTALKIRGVRATLFSIGGLASAGLFVGIMYSAVGFVVEDPVASDRDPVRVASTVLSETATSHSGETVVGDSEAQSAAMILPAAPVAVVPEKATTIASAASWNSRDVDWSHAHPADGIGDWIRKQQKPATPVATPATTRAFAALAYGPAQDVPENAAVRKIEEILARGSETVPVPQVAEREDEDARTSKIRRGVNLRSSGRKGAKVVSVLSRGTVVEVLGCDHWCEVKANGRKGYVYHTYLEDGRKLRSASRR